MALPGGHGPGGRATGTGPVPAGINLRLRDPVPTGSRSPAPQKLGRAATRSRLISGCSFTQLEGEIAVKPTRMILMFTPEPDSVTDSDSVRLGRLESRLGLA